MMRRAIACLSLLCAATVLRAQPRAQIGDGVKHARASIDAISSSGTRARLLVTLAVDSGWHVSWRNPGETGLPTRLSWSLPQGVRVLNETWPVPVIAHTSVGATHTLEGNVPWLVEFAVDSATKVDRLVNLTMRYGICRNVCIPEQLTVQGVLPGQRAPRLTSIAPTLRTRLSVDAGVIGARRISRTELCLARAPLSTAGALPEVIADSGLGLDAAMPLRRRVSARNHVFVMNIPAAAPLPRDTRVLFVRDVSGAFARLDFARGAVGCTTR
ncbi:MAG: hypothetical protein H7099_16380 [Gemmatimonadaceae bacterium]|nr:hypothetical protein [Gemmatimonadaceae bacterium]